MKIQKKVSGFFHMSWMGMEFKMSSFVPRGEWTEEDTLYGDYGTTIRVPMIDNSKKWNIVYVSKWSVDRLIAEELENDIIQTGINKDANDTTIWQWNFKNIEKDTFSWESIYSKDCGKTWKYATKVEAKREM